MGSLLDLLSQRFDVFLNFVATAPPLEVYAYLFKNGGWLILVWVTIGLFWKFYMLSRNGSFLSSYKWVFLAVDVPKSNEQTPKAVEQIFAHIAGAHKNPDLEEVYLQGFLQPWFSFEIVSIEGYVQFIIATEKSFRDLVESAIYAQYPEAEITEIEDYTKDFPSWFPNPEYDLWGTEYILTNKEQSFPIRTYEKFEHSAAEEVFKDPLAAVLEVLSRLGKGEFAGIQILIKPISSAWNNYKKHGDEVVKKLTGAPVKHKDTWLSAIGGIPWKIFEIAREGILGVTTDEHKEIKKEEMPSLMLHLPPEFKDNIGNVEKKLAKICFATKIRFIYLGKKDVFSKAKVAGNISGAIKQFNTEDMNGFKPELDKVGTSTHFFYKKSRLHWKQTKLISAYKFRSRWRGMLEYLMNIEELASVWHFPMLTLKAPMVSKTDARRGAPPRSLPTERELKTIKPLEKKGTPPPNLPV